MNQIWCVFDGWSFSEHKDALAAARRKVPQVVGDAGRKSSSSMGLKRVVFLSIQFQNTAEKNGMQSAVTPLTQASNKRLHAAIKWLNMWI